LVHYERYPDGPDQFAGWQSERDAIMDRVYEQVGAEPKY
jgi:hypothetical protein